MRIAMVAPIEVRVPPVAYGGTERVVSILTEELVRRGHEVTLFASGDSITSANICPIVPEHLWKSHNRSSPPLSLLNIAQAFEQADNFDLIHNHTFFEGLALSGLIKTPLLTTLHGGLSGDLLTLFMRYTGWYNTISKSAKELLPPKNRFAGVIYNAIELESYPFNAGSRNGYLLFLSRVSQEKGPHIAIKVAKKLNMPLLMAGSLHPQDREFFESKVKPHIDGKNVIYEGEVSNKRKKELLANADCLLAPITWPEPFGIFMVEAMACGTPVVAINNGSARELICNGETGYVVDSAEEMVDSVRKIGRIDPEACREVVRRNFDVPIIANNYLRAYEKVLEQKPDLVTSRVLTGM